MKPINAQKNCGSKDGISSGQITPVNESKENKSLYFQENIFVVAAVKMVFQAVKSHL